MLAVGDVVPDFTLLAGSKDGRVEITLSKELAVGEVVLAFYPIAFSSTCTKQMCEIRDDLANLRGLQARVLGFSTDAHHVNTAWARHEALDFPLLSDADATVSKLYGVYKQRNLYGKKFFGIERTTFVIDKTGRIAQIYPKVKVDGHIEEVLEFVRED